MRRADLHPAVSQVSQDELVWLVSFLKPNGDALLAFVDFDWF
jgi:hypothetical protein